MEKKKLLLVTISVGVFLVIVVGAALLAFSPGLRSKKNSESHAVAVREPVSVDAVDIIKNTSGIQGLNPLPASQEIPQETNYYINSDQKDPAPRPGETNSITAPVTIDVPRPRTVAVPDTASSSRNTVVRNTAPAEKKTTAAPAPQSIKKETRSVTETKPAARPKVSAAVYDTFWIQTGSFSAMSRAEVVKESLAGRGITAVIENRDVNGKSFFRVRVGPYTSKNEADYWLSLVKSIEGFEESLVWQDKARL
ncbi:hypothetical protein AGMMS49928_19780 [Spirochaetia bacterium]|nr:hypothetical protein AGMMS49928_19780 [Spirochaetia bacterium]